MRRQDKGRKYYVDTMTTYAVFGSSCGIATIDGQLRVGGGWRIAERSTVLELKNLEFLRERRRQMISESSV